MTGSAEAEYGVIGGILIDNMQMDEVADILDGREFTVPFCHSVYRAALELRRESRPIDFVTIGSRMALDRDGLAELKDIIEVSCASSTVTYATVVRDKAVERRLADIGHEIVKIAGLKKQPLDQKIDKAQRLITTLEVGGEDDTEDLISIMGRVIDDMDYRSQHQGEIIGLSTGFKDIDDRFLGWQAGQLIIIAGRPSMGKSAFAQAIIQNNLLEGKSVYFASLEMSREEVVQRMIASLAGLHIRDVITGGSDEEGWYDRIGAAVQKLKNSKLTVDDNTSMTVSQLKSKARKVWKRKGLDLVVVDYLQLMSGSGDSREQVVADISRELKKLGRELKVPVIALSQLNRGLEQRQDKRPLMSDLRESGAIEQDADVVSFVYRDEVYHENSKEKGVTQIITRKFRNGEIGTDYLASDLSRMRYTDTMYRPDEHTSYTGAVTGKKKSMFSY